MRPPLSIAFDHDQVRIRRDRIATLLDGKSWENRLRDKAFVEPISGTGILLPIPLDPEFTNISDGIYARLRKSDYTLVDESQWIEFDRGRCPGDYYIHLQDADETNQSKRTAAITAPFERNRGVYISFFNYSTGNETRRTALEFGWANQFVAVPPLLFRLYSNGDLEVWRNNVLDGDPRNISENRNDRQLQPTSEEAQEAANRVVDLIILPFRRREILVLSNQGGGFVHTLSDIGDDEEDGTIHAGGRFFWRVPTGKATVQAAPLSFHHEGYLTAQDTIFHAPPELDEEAQFNLHATTLSGTTATARLVKPGFAQVGDDFVPDGLADHCRIRIDMTGNGKFTPNVYGCQAFFQPIFEVTPDERSELMMTGYVMNCALTVPDDPTGVEMQLSISRADELEFGDEDVALIGDIENRPVLVKLDEVQLMNGYGDVPEKLYGRAGNDWLSRIELTVRDEWQKMREYIFSDPTPLDGMTLTRAFSFLADCAGIEQYEIDDFDFTLPVGETNFEGEFLLLIKPGESAEHWWKKLFDTYCPLSFYGVIPGAIATLTVRKDQLTEPSFTIYGSVQEAIDALAATEEEKRDPDKRREFASRVYRSLKRGSVALETNELWVQGFDHRERKPILVRTRNAESSDPSTPKADRPITWLGAPRKYSWTDPSLSTTAMCVRAAKLLCKRLFPRRYFVEWESELLLHDDGRPVWRGDVIELFGVGNVRIQSLSAQFKKEPVHDAWWWRPTRYVGELLPDGGSY